MFRLLIPILVMVIIWVIVLWKVLVQKKKFDVKGLIQVSLFFLGIWALIYWLLFSE
ncbi:MAG: hypothetical protein RLZZ531_2087 [Bacteroidota bacterium]|jgi:hypothetical protein